MTKPGPNRKATDRRILEAINDVYSPAVGTAEIAERVGVERQTADKHLRKLADDGLVETRLIGQVRVWWLSSAGKKRLDDRA